MGDPFDEFERLRILRKHALLAAEAAQETLNQVDAQLSEAIRRLKDERSIPESEPPLASGAPSAKAASRPLNASPEQRLCYWAIFHAGGFSGEGGKRVSYPQIQPHLQGAVTHHGAPLPNWEAMEKRLVAKLGTHLEGGSDSGGWRLTAIGEKSMRRVKDTTTQLSTA